MAKKGYEKKDMKKQQKLRNVALSCVSSRLWGPSTLAKYLVERPHLLPVKHRGKSYKKLFNILKGTYIRLTKNGDIRKIGYATYEAIEKKGIHFISMSDLSLESKEYIPHNKRLIFRIKSGYPDVSSWKKSPMKGWPFKYTFENDMITAELVPANKIFGIPEAKGLIIRLKDPNVFALIKTEEDIEEVNALYNAEIIREAKSLSEQFNIELDANNPIEVLQDGEIHDAITDRLPVNLKFTDTVCKYNSKYNGEEGNKKLEMKTAIDVKNYVRESVNTERIKKVEDWLPVLNQTLSDIHNEYVLHRQIMLDIGTGMKEMPKAIIKGIKIALKKQTKRSDRQPVRKEKSLRSWFKLVPK